MQGDKKHLIVRTMPISKKRKKTTPKLKKKKQSEPKWESFEKIVAAIHIAETKGAMVTWNEIIKNRQFDVTIRFKVGFYEYLTLIECRDYNKPIQVEKVEAFVTKVRHQNANKAVMVSAYGFQSGAKEVALREGIELYSLRQINKLPDDVFTNIFQSFVAIQPFAFRTDGKPAFVFSQDPIKLKYQLENIRFTNYGDRSIGDLIRPLTQLISPVPLPGVPDVEKIGMFKRATPAPIRSSFKMMENTMMIEPESGEKIHVKEFLFTYWSVKAEILNLDGIDPTVYATFGTQYEYKNELNNEVTFIDPTNLSLGINTILEEGKFEDGTWIRIHDYLYEEIRGQMKRDKQPSAGIVDSQSVKTTEKGGRKKATTAERKSLDGSGTLS